jgi:hypothetical protein
MPKKRKSRIKTKRGKAKSIIAPPSNLPKVPSDKEVVAHISRNARDINKRILAKHPPSLHFPLR